MLSWLSEFIGKENSAEEGSSKDGNLGLFYFRS